MVSIKSKFLQMIDFSTIHGLPNFFRTKLLTMKIIWFISFLVSSLSCLYFIIVSISTYFTFSYSTKINFVYEKPLKFPAVSFCSLTSDFNNKSLDEVIFECFFDANSCLGNTEKYFSEFNDPYLGKCYRLNGGRYSYLSGRHSGFHLGVIVKQGLVLYIHHQSKTPYPFEIRNNLNTETIFIASGYMADINFELIINEKLDEPYNKCIKDPSKFDGNKSIINYILRNLSRSYDQEYCIQLFYKFEYLRRKFLLRYFKDFFKKSLQL